MLSTPLDTFYIIYEIMFAANQSDNAKCHETKYSLWNYNKNIKHDQHIRANANKPTFIGVASRKETQHHSATAAGALVGQRSE